MRYKYYRNPFIKTLLSSITSGQKLHREHLSVQIKWIYTCLPQYCCCTDKLLHPIHAYNKLRTFLKLLKTVYTVHICTCIFLLFWEKCILCPTHFALHSRVKHQTYYIIPQRLYLSLCTTWCDARGWSTILVLGGHIEENGRICYASTT